MSNIPVMPLANQIPYIQDPSHGWLKVALVELVFLGIEKEISTCSYYCGEYAFLEEDVDARRYLQAREESGYASPKLFEVHQKQFNRGLPSIRAIHQNYWEAVRAWIQDTYQLAENEVENGIS